MLKESPFILYSDGKGNIFEDKSLYTTGRSGWDAFPIDPEDWIELPKGGSLYELPGRRGIGVDVLTGEMRLCMKGWAVAAFIPPAHTGLFLAAYETGPDAPTLPLFCYTAAGWQDDKFFVPAVRIEQDIRQDCAGYDQTVIESGVSTLLKAYPHNRLVNHLANNCALTYHCPAARNFFMGRWECPIPTSPALQCQLYRLHLFSAAGRDHSPLPRTGLLSSPCQRRSSNSPSRISRKRHSRS